MTTPPPSLFDFGPLAAGYESWYETGAGRHHDAAQRRLVLSQLAPPLPGADRLLDVGCGTGHWSRFFAQCGYEVTGIDVSPEMIAAARKYRDPRCRFEVADAASLPFADGEFDMACAMAVLEFVPDVRSVCAEMVRCVKPGGGLVIGCLNPLAAINRQRLAAGAEPYASARMLSAGGLRGQLEPFGDVTILETCENEGAAQDGPPGAFLVVRVKTVSPRETPHWKASTECLPCLSRQISEAVSFCIRDVERRRGIVSSLLTGLDKMCIGANPVAVSQKLHRRIRLETGNPDPYREIKSRMNSLTLRLLPELREAIRNAADPRLAALRLAVAGNLIDSGAKSQISETEVHDAIRRAVSESLHGDGVGLFAAAARAKRILYLADNSGEIVLDRLLLEALPTERITVAVRGAPILNDATMEDACTAGISSLVPVIHNGSDAPGTILDDCSEEFRRAYGASDLVISKGQGNYESLYDPDKHVFFLLRVKCPMVATSIGAPLGAMVVYEQCPRHGDGAEAN